MKVALCLFLQVSLLAQVTQAPAGRVAPADTKQPPSLPPEDLCRLEGIVTNQITGEPVKKASVTVLALSGIAATASAITDSSGGFTVLELPPGQYSITAQHPSFISPQYVPNRASSQKTVTLKPGETKKGVTISVMPAASISGQVLDAEGDPVQYCQIHLMLITTQRGRRHLMTQNAGATNLNGEYRIGQMAPGKYYVFARFRGEPAVAHPLQAVVPGNPPSSGEGYGPQFYPGSVDFSGASPVMLTAGTETRGVDFRLLKRPVFRLRGRITGPDDAMTQQTQIRLRPNDPLLADDGSHSMFAPTRPNGEFVIPYVTPGSYTVYAVSIGQKGRFVGSQGVEVGTEPPPPITLTLAGGVKIAGSIEIEGDQDTSLQNLRVQLVDANRQPIGRVPEAALEGTSFTLLEVNPGSWRVIVDNLAGRGYVKAVRYGDHDSPDGIIDVQAGAPGTLHLAVSAKGGTIEANVEHAGENPRLIEVTLIPEGDQAQDSSLYRTLVLPGSGSPAFAFQQLPPGKYRLFAVGTVNSGFIDNAELQRALESHSESVTLEEGGRVTRTLKVITAEQMADVSKQ